MRIRILDEAQSDLREGAQFYEQQSDGLGLYFLDTLFSDISKDNQLFLFLNICYLDNENGQAIHGYANAARIYFRKEFSAITEDDFFSKH